MGQRYYPFVHGGVRGAVIEVLNPAQWDLNQMLPEHLQLSENSIVTYTYACAVLTLHKRHIMVDAGFHAQQVVDALNELRIQPEGIELVLVTHGDADHVGGLLTPQGTLTFPNAEVVLDRALWRHWHDPVALKAMPEQNRLFYQDVARLLNDRIRTFSEETTIDEGIGFIPCPGHRHGHAVYEFQTQASPILHFGDTLFHPLYAQNPRWPDTMALDPEQEVISRRRMLERAAESKALVLTGHIPFPGMGTIRHQADAYCWHPTTKEQS